MLRRSTFREIRNSLGRYLSIIAIVALGVGFFSGLKITKTAMIETADEYLKTYRMYDYSLYSTIGFDRKSVKQIQNRKEVISAEGTYEKDVFLKQKGQDEFTAKILTGNNKINRLELKAGRFAKKADECVVDAHVFSEDDIGKYLYVSKKNSTKDRKVFRYSRYRITGLAASPLYINYERGSTDIGDGKIDAFVALNREGIKPKYYTGIYVTENRKHPNFSDSYDDFIDRRESGVKKAASEARVSRYRRIVKKARKKLKKSEKKYRDARRKFDSKKRNAEREFKKAEREIKKGKAEIRRNVRKMKKQKPSLLKKRQTLLKRKADLENQESQLEASKNYIPPQQYAASMNQINAGKKEISSYLKQVNAGLLQIKRGRKDVIKAKKTIKKNASKLKKAKAKAKREFAKAERKLDDAKRKLDDARDKISKIDSGKCYVLTRSSNIGYSTFENNAQIVTSISKIFPVFFFLVAALVCMTTMTRMIDEQRTQIGVLKALGYDNRLILGKYMFYSGSAAAMGAVAGYFLGVWIFPAVIWHAYTMMYEFADSVNFVIDWPLFFMTLSVSLICALGATWLSCEGEFRIAPANLIRPKAPKSGRRILLERIDAVWNRISFMWKISLRNVFRYKGRFIMMCLGISGCTALLIAGFGINTSVKNLAVFQYDEVMTYDYQISFSKNMNEARQKKFIEKYGYGDDVLFLYESSVDIKYGGKSHEANMIAADAKRIGKFVNLHSGEEKVQYPKDGEILICDRFRKHYGINVGDTVTVTRGYRSIRLKVSGIVDNYVNDFTYVNEKTAKKFLGGKYSIKTAFVKLKEGSESSVIRKHSTKAARQKYVMNVSVNQDMLDRIEDMMESLNAVVVLVIASAATLALIVLYNLTNINITERIREIATIKVLGFYPGEVSSYVFRENFLMTGFSLFLGIPLGKWLLSFVIDQIRVDLTYFVPRIRFTDYLWSLILTFVFTALVNVIMYRRLKNISMTESLKSVE